MRTTRPEKQRKLTEGSDVVRAVVVGRISLKYIAMKMASSSSV